MIFADTAGPGLTHNGIYIGGGQFVNARDEWSGVRVDSLWDGYWASHYWGARRAF